MGTLYIVPTPLGNLEDITLRAVRILGQVDLIATEDTRTTGKLLKHLDISCPMVSYFEHSNTAQRQRVLNALSTGDVALVSEAGTPLLSDPGYVLVQAAIEQEITVVPLPGPSALTTALSASGLPTDQFLFLGFLPRKATERRRLLAGVSKQTATLVFFESPHRLRNTLADMADSFGPDRRVAVCRELTKLHEEIWRGTVADAQKEWAEREPRGEFTLIAAGANPPAAWGKAKVEASLVEALAGGSTPKDAVRQVTNASGWPKRDVYALVQKIKQTK